MSYRVTCKGCRASTVTEDGNSDALQCACCQEDHSHEENANSGDICRPCDIEFIGPIGVS